MLTNQHLENLEHFYLDQINQIILSRLSDIHFAFESKNYLRDYWVNYGETGSISESSTGIERIVYSIFGNFGIPVAAPTGSDLFFETENAFVHIDVKTFVTANIGDAKRNIPVGDNQNSYSGYINSNSKNKFSREYVGNLPKYYEFKLGEVIIKKPCLTYFLVFITNEHTDKILGIFTTCMPNGQLYGIYGDSVLAAGKNPGKIRFNYSRFNFNTILGTPKRTILAYNDNTWVTPSFIC